MSLTPACFFWVFLYELCIAVSQPVFTAFPRIIDQEFGPGAGERLERIEKMYHRVGSSLVWFATQFVLLFTGLYVPICSNTVSNTFASCWYMLELYGFFLLLLWFLFVFLGHGPGHKATMSSGKSFPLEAALRLAMWRICSLWLLSTTSRIA